jgi:hypothetical protein
MLQQSSSCRPRSSNAHEIVLPEGSWPDRACTEKAMAAVHALLKIFPDSLKITVQFSYDCLDGHVYDIMKKYGWKVMMGKPGFVPFEKLVVDDDG